MLASPDFLGSLLGDCVSDESLVECVQAVRGALEAQCAAVAAAVDHKKLAEYAERVRTTVSAVALDQRELERAIGQEERQLLQECATAVAPLRRQLVALEQLERLLRQPGDTERLVAKVTFFFFVSYSRAVKTYVAQHPNTHLPPERIDTFLERLRPLAERYSDHGIDGAQFVHQVQEVYKRIQ